LSILALKALSLKNTAIIQILGSQSIKVVVAALKNKVEEILEAKLETMMVKIVMKMIQTMKMKEKDQV
jgi:hypothetical protein